MSDIGETNTDAAKFDFSAYPPDSLFTTAARAAIAAPRRKSRATRLSPVPNAALARSAVAASTPRPSRNNTRTTKSNS